MPMSAHIAVQVAASMALSPMAAAALTNAPDAPCADAERGATAGAAMDAVADADAVVFEPDAAHAAGTGNNVDTAVLPTGDWQDAWTCVVPALVMGVDEVAIGNGEGAMDAAQAASIVSASSWRTSAAADLRGVALLTRRRSRLMRATSADQLGGAIGRDGDDRVATGGRGDAEDADAVADFSAFGMVRAPSCSANGGGAARGDSWSALWSVTVAIAAASVVGALVCMDDGANVAGALAGLAVDAGESRSVGGADQVGGEYRATPLSTGDMVAACRVRGTDAVGWQSAAAALRRARF